MVKTKIMRMKIFFLFLFVFSSLGSFAQLNTLNTKSSASGLFVHTDKTVYLTNETIWFSAYFLAKAAQDQHRLLNIVISSADSGKILIAEKYPMNYGISIGKLILPDSVKSGTVKLIAFTDVLDRASNPAVFFTATLTIGHQQSMAMTSPFSKLLSYKEDSSNVSYVKAQLSTDRPAYQKREEVKIKVKLPSQSLFSVAAVYNTRLTNDHQRIMEVKTNASVQPSSYIPQPLTLIIKKKNRAIDKTVDVVLFGNKGLKFLSTDQTGQLQLQRDDLLSPYGKKLALMVGAQHQGYQIELHDPMLPTAMLLAKQHLIPTAQLVNRQQNSLSVVPNFTEKTVELNAVTIKGRTSSAANVKGKLGINDCGDWVDEYDYLNYPYSEKKYHPVIGKLYKKRIDIDPIARSFKVEPIYYSGCESSTQKNATLIKGVNLEAPFYGLDQSSTALQYLTTLTWAAGLLTNSSGEADLSFSTADLSGEYRVILQGISATGVCYGEVIFVVK